MKLISYVKIAEIIVVWHSKEFCINSQSLCFRFPKKKNILYSVKVDLDLAVTNDQ